eukprot:6697285-Prymnesium_polylepis.1
MRRKAVPERYAALRSLWHEVGVVERSRWPLSTQPSAAHAHAALAPLPHRPGTRRTPPPTHRPRRRPPPHPPPAAQPRCPLPCVLSPDPVTTPAHGAS